MPPARFCEIPNFGWGRTATPLSNWQPRSIQCECRKRVSDSLFLGLTVDRLLTNRRLLRHATAFSERSLESEKADMEKRQCSLRPSPTASYKPDCGIRRR